MLKIKVCIEEKSDSACNVKIDKITEKELDKATNNEKTVAANVVQYINEAFLKMAEEKK